jgi:hypothetical protein
MLEIPSAVQQVAFPAQVALGKLLGKLLGKYRKYANAPDSVRR